MTSAADSQRRRRRPAAEGREAVLNAGLQAFRQRGYHGTSVRDLARMQDLTVAAMYHWFPSKYDLLVELMTRAMDDLIADVAAAIKEADPTPVARLSAAVRTQVLFHTERQDEAFVGNSELRSLEPTELREVLKRRDKLERMFQNIIEDGVEDGSFAPDDPDEARRAILAMTVAIHTWYRPRGKLKPGELADRYVTMALELLHARRQEA